MMWGVWGDRKHWELFLGPVRIHRWCPGPPCQEDHKPRPRHWVRTTIRR